MGDISARTLPRSGQPDNLGASGLFGPVTLRGGQVSIWASWTGTPSGTFKLECTFDGQTWLEVPGASAEFTANGQAQPSGSAGQGIYTWYGVPGQQMRLVYSATGGTGTLSAYVAQGG